MMGESDCERGMVKEKKFESERNKRYIMREIKKEREIVRDECWER